MHVFVCLFILKEVLTYNMTPRGSSVMLSKQQCKDDIMHSSVSGLRKKKEEARKREKEEDK